MINFNKKDPVADAVKSILEKELSPKQKKIAALAGDKKVIDALDLAALRAGKKPTSEETVEENAFDYTTPRKPEPNGGSGVKKGTRYGGSKQKDKPEHDDDKMKKEEVEQIDELSKSTLGSYVKGAARDMSAARKLGADFKNAADKSRNPSTKKANTSLSDKFNATAQKRNTGIGKAVERLTKEETEQIDEKNWIAGAIKHPGAETAAAKKAGMSVQAYAKKHQHDSGTAGKRARLAMTLKKMKENYEEPIIDEMISEVLSKDASAGDWIHDFVHSDNPKFAGKSKAERKKMALGAYYKKQNEEVEGVEEAMRPGFDWEKAAKDTQRRQAAGYERSGPYSWRKKKEEKPEAKPPVKEEVEPSDRTEDTLAGRVKSKQKDDVGPKSDGRSTKVKYHPGPMTQKEEADVVDENFKEKLKSAGRKTFKALTGGSDEDQRKDLQRKMGVPQTGKKPSDK